MKSSSSEDSPRESPLAHRKYPRKFRVLSLVLLAVFFGCYPILSWFGGYFPSQSGRLRWNYGLSVTDIRIWHPYGLYWQPYTSSRGEETSKGDLLGYLYSPLIRFDRAFVHPTEYYFPPDG